MRDVNQAAGVVRNAQRAPGLLFLIHGRITPPPTFAPAGYGSRYVTRITALAGRDLQEATHYLQDLSAAGDNCRGIIQNFSSRFKGRFMEQDDRLLQLHV
ncbi:hypothetical protein KCP78_09935 [Salmonella enterica subsp. enterica]|nr:hypothetical protein KCP78_09935 [Salmonella enterica subsp. enterica]